MRWLSASACCSPWRPASRWTGGAERCDLCLAATLVGASCPWGTAARSPWGTTTAAVGSRVLKFSEPDSAALQCESAWGGAARPCSPSLPSPWGPGGLLLKITFVLIATSVIVVFAYNIDLCLTLHCSFWWLILSRYPCNTQHSDTGGRGDSELESGIVGSGGALPVWR